MVDVAQGKVVPGQTVLIQGDHIVKVAPGLAAPAGAKAIDGTGRYLIPGLMDMHTHIMNEDQLYLYLAGGVTTIRHMASSPRDR